MRSLSRETQGTHSGWSRGVLGVLGVQWLLELRGVRDSPGGKQTSHYTQLRRGQGEDKDEGGDERRIRRGGGGGGGGRRGNEKKEIEKK